MKRLVLLVALFVLPFIPSWAAAAVPDKWESEVAALETAQHNHPAAPGSVLFIGSSSIRLWKTLAEDFPGVPTINHGFGGTQTSDSVAYFDRLVTPSKPRLVVFYAGTNDIAAGKTPEVVAADFRAFCAKLHAALPQAKVIYIGLGLAPSRWALRDKMTLANALVAAYCAADSRRQFLDLNPFMLTAEGEARPELYVKDQLHMNPSGYQIWKKALAPFVK